MRRARTDAALDRGPVLGVAGFPHYPPGTLGSISHSGHHTVAVGRTDRRRGLGIDLGSGHIPVEAAPLVLHPSEDPGLPTVSGHGRRPCSGRPVWSSGAPARGPGGCRRGRERPSGVLVGVLAVLAVVLTDGAKSQPRDRPERRVAASGVAASGVVISNVAERVCRKFSSLLRPLRSSKDSRQSPSTRRSRSRLGSPKPAAVEGLGFCVSSIPVGRVGGAGCCGCGGCRRGSGAQPRSGASGSRPIRKSVSATSTASSSSSP